MKGYLVGYVGSWADDLVPVVVGYYTGWQKAIDAGKVVESDNITHHNCFRKVFILETENNTTNVIEHEAQWYKSYTHHIFNTSGDTTVLNCYSGKQINLGILSMDNGFKPVKSRYRKPHKK